MATKLSDSVEHAVEAGLDVVGTRPTRTRGISQVRDLPDRPRPLRRPPARRHPGPARRAACGRRAARAGAASAIAPEVYRRAGAEVIAIAAEPDGLNINDGVGSRHLDLVRRAVLEHGADLGIAHDGDADRCLAVDASGADVDGDRILAVLALAMRDANELVNNTLVATVMSNLGLHLAMRNAGIAMRTTAVGDRYVLEELRAGGFTLGGEQSGHVVLPAHATTGDGLLTALRLMARMAVTQRPLAELASVVTVLPQVLENVRVADKEAVAASDDVRRRRRRRAGAGRHRTRAAAAVGHRTARARDGRGGRPPGPGEGHGRADRRGGRGGAVAPTPRPWSSQPGWIGQLSDAHTVRVVDARTGQLTEPRPGRARRPPARPPVRPPTPDRCSGSRLARSSASAAARSDRGAAHRSTPAQA